MKPETEIKGLYAISNHVEQNDREFLEAMEAALRGGVSIIQLREKGSSDNQKYRRATELKALCQKHNALLFINDDPLLCKKVDADGVHLGQKDSSLIHARAVLGNNYLVGQSCHNSADFAKQADEQGANYIALGRFFPSQTKPDAPQASIDCINKVRKVSPLPLVAIGGITLDNAPRLLQENVQALAVIHDLWSSEDIEARARAYSRLF